MSDVSTSGEFNLFKLEKIIRRCCRQHRIIDHNRPLWNPKYQWGEFGHDQKGKRFEKMNKERIKELRRKQFFSFFADFFDKLEQGSMLKNLRGTNFTDEEKEEWIKTYFKRYYMENLVLKEEVVKLKVDTAMAAKKRQCSCTIGQYNEKTGKLVSPDAIGVKEKVIKVKLKKDLATREMMDA